MIECPKCREWNCRVVVSKGIEYIECMSCYSFSEIQDEKKAGTSQETAEKDASVGAFKSDTKYPIEKQGEINMAAEMINLIVGDVGKKSVSVGTLWYDKSRKAILSGQISVDKLRDALKDGTVSSAENPKAGERFKGDKLVRVAGFPVVRRVTAPETADVKGGDL